MAEWCRTECEFKIVVDVGPFEASDIEMRADHKQVTIRASHPPRPAGPGVFSRQFEGRISLPAELEPSTLRATLIEGHLVVVTGTTWQKPHPPPHERIIPVFAVHNKQTGTGRNGSHCGVGPGGP